MMVVVLNGACDGECQPAEGGSKYSVSSSERTKKHT